MIKRKKSLKAFWKYFSNPGIYVQLKLLATSVIDSNGNEVKQPEGIVNTLKPHFKRAYNPFLL